MPPRRHPAPRLALAALGLTALGLAALAACGDRPAQVVKKEVEIVEVRAETPEAPPPGAPSPVSEAILGAPAPDFTLPDLDGAAHTLAAHRGKVVVLEWFNPECPFVKYAHEGGELRTMAATVAPEGVVWLAINSGAPGKQGHGAPVNREAAARWGLTHPILLDEDGAVGRRYGAAKTPHMFVIDPAGVLVYRGAIDNAPMGEVRDGSGAKRNHVADALADLSAARPVALPDTPAYGCSVKYAT